MRILHVLRAPVGGLFRHVLDLSAEQARRGHDVGLVVADTADELTSRRLVAAEPNLTLGIERLAIPRGIGSTDIQAALAVRRRVQALGVDVVHGHGAKGGAYARLAGLKVRVSGRPVRVVYTPHGGTLNFDPKSVEGRVYHAMERVLDAATSGIVFESAFAAATFQSVIGAGRAPRRVVHNGLRPSDFEPRRLAPDAADLLFVGELRFLKGVDVLLGAIHDLTLQGRPVSAVIVGSGPDRAVFEATAATLGLADRVRFTGAMPAADAFGLGRILIVPSRKESLPYIVLEAAAAGVPLIATNVGGIPEIVDGSDTTLVPADDAAALARAVAVLLDDPELAAARARRLYGAVHDRFTVGRMADDIASFYDDLAEPMPRGGASGVPKTDAFVAGPPR